jgi:hypothetical protein
MHLWGTEKPRPSIMCLGSRITGVVLEFHHSLVFDHFETLEALYSLTTASHINTYKLKTV